MVRPANTYSHMSTRATRKHDDKRHGARYDIIDPLERNARTFLHCCEERKRKSHGTRGSFNYTSPGFFTKRGSSIRRFSGSERIPFLLFPSSVFFFPSLFVFLLLHHYVRSNLARIYTPPPFLVFLSFFLSSFLSSPISVVVVVSSLCVREPMNGARPCVTSRSRGRGLGSGMKCGVDEGVGGWMSGGVQGGET